MHSIPTLTSLSSTSELCFCKLHPTSFILTDFAFSRIQVRHLPIIILIGGPPKSGKSTLASLLARTFGIPAIINTDVMWEVLELFQQVIEEPTSQDTKTNQSDQLQVHIMSQVHKRIDQKKSAIIEGSHIVPELFEENIQDVNKIIPVIPLFISTSQGFQRVVRERMEMPESSFDHHEGFVSCKSDVFVNIHNDFCLSLESLLNNAEKSIFEHICCFIDQVAPFSD
jgi:hypothetical protein